MDDLIAGEMDYWALGHIHRFHVLRESNPAVVYSGNSQARHMRESGEKGCCLVTLNENTVPLIQFIPIDAVRYVQGDVDLSGTITLEEVIHVVRSRCEYFVDQIDQKDAFINLSLNGRISRSTLWMNFGLPVLPTLFFLVMLLMPVLSDDQYSFR